MMAHLNGNTVGTLNEYEGVNDEIPETSPYVYFDNKLYFFPGEPHRVEIVIDEQNYQLVGNEVSSNGSIAAQEIYNLQQ